MDALAARAKAQLGTRTLPLPPFSRGDLALCAGGCSAELETDAFAMSVGSFAGLELEAGFRLRARALPAVYQRRWLCAFQGEPACAVDIDTARGRERALRIELPVRLRVEHSGGAAQGRAVGGPLALRAQPPRLVAGIESEDLTIAAANTCGQPYCAAASLPPVRSMLAERVNEALSSELSRWVQPLLCQPCSGGCAPGSRCVQGVCQQRDGACEAIPLGASFEMTAEGGAAWQLYAALADQAASRRAGLEAALRVSNRFSKRAACAPPRPAPASSALPLGLFDQGADGDAHLRLLLGEATLKSAAWAAHQAGFFCRTLDASALPSWMVRLLLPSDALSGDVDANSTEIVLRPLQAPSIVLRSGGRMTITLASIEVQIRASVGGTAQTLAAATYRGQGELSLVTEGHAVIALVDRGSLVLELVGARAQAPPSSRARPARAQAAVDASLRPLFELIGRLALASFSDRFAIIESLPPGLQAQGAPATRVRGGHRALELAFRLAQP